MMLGFELRLKQLRKWHGVTQKQLAADLGASERGIQQYELGERKPTFEATAKLSRYFNISADYLLGLTDEPRPLNPTPLDTDHKSSD